MQKYILRAWSMIFGLLIGTLLVTGCTGNSNAPKTKAQVNAPANPNLPSILRVAPDRTELPRYELIELSVALKATYNSPYDARQVSLDGDFTGPDGTHMRVPGFWDGEASWRVRFTPDQAGKWTYQLTVSDSHGVSMPYNGNFKVTTSDLHGWLQAGNWVNPAYSGHYLVYKDGTPFYGVGHCDALNLLWEGYSADKGITLFDDMKKAGENYVVWWPLYSNSPISSSYADYSVPNLKIIDNVVDDAQKKGIFLVFTIWDHPELRDDTHAWDGGQWAKNGFRELGDIDSFFTSDEAWAWQENFYRYILARWGYSPAIAMWGTVSEINGTNSYNQTDPWHKKVNDYFVTNDPYRHLTTASKSGDINWTAGFKVMDVSQVHVYTFNTFLQPANAVKAADIMADWTALMWKQADKPNWIGEFGMPDDSYYPELFHNSIWAALGSGAAMTPAEWNDSQGWGEMTQAMLADIGRLSQFVSGLPLAKWNPVPLKINSLDPQVRGWGVAGKDGGLFWVQDFSLEGKTIEEVRIGLKLRGGVRLQLQGLATGTFTVTPYDTWQGIFLAPTTIHCIKGKNCLVALPDFKADMAFKIERK